MSNVLAAAVAVVAASSASAATLCATTPAQLQAALMTAAGNGQHDDLRIRAGTYDLSNVDLVYDPSTPEDFDLDISGGWTPFFENPCGQHLTDDPWQTTLDGGGNGRILRLTLDDESDVSIRYVTFLDGHVDPGLGAGLAINYTSDAAGTITVERNVFMLNQADQSSALSIQGGSLQHVTNNLFLFNEGGSRAVAYLTTTAPLGVNFTNNTVLSNSHTNTQQPALQVAAGRVFIANNNFWDNDGFDIDPGTAGDRFIYNNNYQSRRARGGEVVQDNISVEPAYQSGFLNFTPVRGSALVDAGREPQGFLPLWYLTDLDLNGSPRKVGVHVDIGAFENDRIFANGFETAGPFGAGPHLVD